MLWVGFELRLLGEITESRTRDGWLVVEGFRAIIVVVVYYDNRCKARQGSARFGSWEGKRHLDGDDGVLEWQSCLGLKRR